MTQVVAETFEVTPDRVFIFIEDLLEDTASCFPTSISEAET